MIELSLAFPDLMAAQKTVTMRMELSGRSGRNHASTYDRTHRKRFDEEMVGACAELAVSQHLGIPYDRSVNTFKKRGDVVTAGGEHLEVRATGNPNGRLIVRENDVLDRWFVFCTVEEWQTVRVWGFIKGAEARRIGEPDNPHGYRPAWWVRREQLVPPR